MYDYRSVLRENEFDERSRIRGDFIVPIHIFRLEFFRSDEDTRLCCPENCGSCSDRSRRAVRSKLVVGLCCVERVSQTLIS